MGLTVVFHLQVSTSHLLTPRPAYPHTGSYTDASIPPDLQRHHPHVSTPLRDSPFHFPPGKEGPEGRGGQGVGLGDHQAQVSHPRKATD